MLFNGYCHHLLYMLGNLIACQIIFLNIRFQQLYISCLKYILYVQYFLEQMKVPRVESKLRVFSFKIQFGCQVWRYLHFSLFPMIILFNYVLSCLILYHFLQISEFKKNLNAVNSACEEVCIDDSETFSVVFVYSFSTYALVHW